MQRADKRKYHYIYRITRDDGRYYIGMHSTDDLEDGYFGSGKLITRSIKKHGIERHRKEILEFLPDRAALKQREKQLLSEDVRTDKACMNIAPGGGGGFNDEAHMLKFVKAGGSVSGKKNHLILHTPEIRKLAAKTLKSKIANGQLNWSGKMHSAESKLKIAASMKNKQDGEKNSQFGTCWVTKDSKPMKIKKEQLAEYLANGYSRGRK